MGLRNRGPKGIPSDSRFIGRENILEDFGREWSKPIEQAPRFIVNLHGLGGIGKSKLLEQFLLRYAQNAMVCKLDANFDDLNDPLTVLKTILRKTRQHGESVEFEETQKLLAKFDKLVNEAAKASGELPSVIAQMLIKGAQVGGELLEAPVREITAKFVQELNEQCDDGTKFVLIVDTYEKVPSNLDQWLLKDLLDEPATPINFDFRILIAGREPLIEVNRHWHDEWGGELLAFKVDPFTLEETSAFLLQRRGIVQSEIVEKLYAITRGYPFWLDLWANSGIDPEHFFSSGHLQKIEDRLFEMFPDQKHQLWLRQAAIFQRFNQDLLALLIEDEVDKAFEWLVHQSSLVEGSEKFWKIHDLARKVILTNLRNRSQALLAQPAGRILQHFEQKLQQSWQAWRDLRLRLKLSEQDLHVLYEISYYQALAHAEITDDHLDMILRVSDTNLTITRNSFNSASQALSDIDQIVPQKITIAQNLIETLTREFKEEDLDAKKSDVLRQHFSDYQKAILLNRVAKAYGNKLKQVEKAMACFGAIFEKYSEYENALLAKAQLISDTDSEGAIAITKIVLTNNPNHENAIFELGYCYNKLGKHVEAIDQYRRATEIDTQYRAAYAWWAWSLVELGRHEKAIEFCKKTIEIDPKYAWAYSYCGRSLGKLDRHEEAIEQYKKAIELNSNFVEAYNDWAWSLSELGRHEEAIEQCKKAIEIDPKNAATYNRWGWNLGKLGRHEEAIEQCKKAIEIDPKNAAAYNRWGNRLYYLGRYEEAIEQYKKAIEINPKYATAYANWGLSLGKLSRHEEAIEQYKKAIEIDPEDAVAYNNWGNRLRDLGRHEEAIDLYKKAIEIDPKYTTAYNGWGSRLYDLGRYEEAIEQYKKALEIDSRYTHAYNNLGKSFGKLGRHEEAVEQYKKAIEINPKYASAYNNWGNRLRDLGRNEEAIEQYKKAIEIDPKYATAYSNWGWCLGKLGNLEEAIKKCDTAIELDPKEGWAYTVKGFVYSYMGNLELAIANQVKALDIDSNSLESCYCVAIAKRRVNHGDASDFAEKVRSLCMNQPQNDRLALYALGGLAAVEGNFDMAIERLRQATYEDFYSVREWAQKDIAWESLRDAPEFKTIFQRQLQS